MASNRMQLMYKLPILTGCLAILECNSEEHRMEFNIDPESARIVSVGGPGDRRDRPELRGRHPSDPRRRSTADRFRRSRRDPPAPAPIRTSSPS